MKKAILFIITHLLCYSLVAQEQIQTLIQKLKDPESKSILVIAHRGDWRNAPENSLQAFKNCIEMGVHMIEIDLKKTKDGHLILMHDETIDRTTNGIGKPENYTLEEIRKFHLKNGLGIVTRHIIPTFEEVLKLCKGKILINVDKGYEYFKEVYALTEQSGTTEQVIIKSAYPLSKVKKRKRRCTKKSSLYAHYQPGSTQCRKTRKRILKNIPNSHRVLFPIIFSTSQLLITKNKEYAYKNLD